MNHRGVVSMQKLKQKVFFAKVKQGTCKAKAVISLFMPKPPSIPPSVHWSSTHPHYQRVPLKVDELFVSVYEYQITSLPVRALLRSWWALCFFVSFCERFCAFFSPFVFLFLSFLCFFLWIAIIPPKQLKCFLPLRRDFWTFDDFHQNLPYQTYERMYVPSHTITITDKGSICELGEEDSRQFQEVNSIEIQLDNI